MHFHPRILPFSDLLSQVRDVIKHHKHENESEAHQVRSLILRLYSSLSCAPDFPPSTWSPAQRSSSACEPSGLFLPDISFGF